MNDKYGQVVGHFSEKTVSLLGLDVEIGTDIFLSLSTIEHIERKHPEITGDLNKIISEILENPDYIGYNSFKRTVDFIIANKTRLCVPVRPSSDGIYFVRSMFMLHKRYFERLKKKGAIILVDKTNKS